MAYNFYSRRRRSSALSNTAESKFVTPTNLM